MIDVLSKATPSHVQVPSQDKLNEQSARGSQIKLLFFFINPFFHINSFLLNKPFGLFLIEEVNSWFCETTFFHSHIY